MFSSILPLLFRCRSCLVQANLTALPQLAFESNRFIKLSDKNSRFLIHPHPSHDFYPDSQYRAGFI